MKLSHLHEYGPSDRAKLHSQISRSMRSDKERWIIETVRQHLIEGSSQVKEPLSTGEISMDDLIDSIKSKRCVPTHAYDIGHTYVRNLIGNAIRAEFKGAQDKFQTNVNDARAVFGLPSVNPETKASRNRQRSPAQYR